MVSIKLTFLTSFIFLIFFLPLLKAQDHDNPLEVLDFKEENYKKIIEKDGREILPERNELTGVYDHYYSIDDDTNRHSLFLNLNANPVQILGIKSLDYSYGHKITDFWLELFLSWMMADFQSMAHNPIGSSPLSTSEYNTKRDNNTKETLLSFGAGVGYRFRFPEKINILKIDNLFHSATAYASYHQLHEAYIKNNYNGFGLRADYGLFKRYSSQVHIGFRYSYNMAVVSRGERHSKETNNDRRLLLAWSTIGLDLSYYY